MLVAINNFDPIEQNIIKFYPHTIIINKSTTYFSANWFYEAAENCK